MFKNSKDYNEFLRQVAEDIGALNEAKTKIRGGTGTGSQTTLNEAEGDIEPFDKVTLFQDLADIESSLSDAFARLYVYKSQHIENPRISQALSQLRIGVNDLLKKVTSTMSGMGLENDVPME